jgi:hypothetical protein
VVVTALGALLWLAAGVAAGDEPADRLAAQELLSRGYQLSVNGDYLAALDAFRAAYARYPSPKLLLNIGTTLRHLGRNVEAAETYEAYLRDPGAEPARKVDLAKILGEIEAVVGHVRIQVNDPSVTVRLDGRQLDGAALSRSVRVTPGEHIVSATKEGLPAALRTVKLVPGEEQVVKIDLESAGRPVIAAAPVSAAQRTAGFVVGGLGAAGLAVGAVLGVLAKTRSDAANAYCLARVDCTQQGLDIAGAAKTDATVSTVLFAVGGAAVAAGIALVLTAPAPAAAPQGGLVRLMGTF